MNTAEPDAYRYSAFISYSHKDKRWAEWLHRAIESYRVPRKIRRELGVGARLAPVFIDRAEFEASDNLAAAAEAALRQARRLIVVCSPNAVASRWVNEEVRRFKHMNQGSVLCLVVAGDPSAYEGDQVCFPPALRFEVVDGVITDRPGPEPLAADVRPGADRKSDARLKLLAPLLGVNLDALRQRELARAQRRLMLVASGSAIVLTILTALTITAVLARQEAERQRATAERTTDFLKSLFKVSDPSEARGAQISAREILDRGAQQIDHGLADQPAVRADLTTTLADVYASLGLYHAAEALAGKAGAIKGQSSETRAQLATLQGEIQFADSRFDPARRSFEHALAIIGDTRSPLHARALIGLGEIDLQNENYARAEQLFGEAQQMSLSLQPPDQDGAITAVRSIAGSAFLEGDYPRAERYYREAIEARRRLSGPLHPDVSDGLNSLGAIAYMRGDESGAEARFSEALALRQQVLGPAHPIVGMTMNNLARIKLERRKFEEAQSLLEKARAIVLAQNDPDIADMTFVYASLGVAAREMREYPRAQNELQQALQTAAMRHHRLEGPILVDLADLKCQTGHIADALTDLARARPLIAKDYPKDLWRMALADSVEGGCRLAQGQTGQAAPLIEKSLPILLKKWGEQGLYGFDARRRMQALERARTPPSAA